MYSIENFARPYAALIRKNCARTKSITTYRLRFTKRFLFPNPRHSRKSISHQIYPFRLNILSIAILFYVQTFTTFNYGESTNYKLYFLYYIFITILYIHFLLISSHLMKKKFEISKYLPPLIHYTERVKPAIVCFPVVHTREATAWPRVFRYPSCGSRIGFENVAAVPSTIVHGVIRFKCAISVIRGRVTRSRGKPRRTLHSPSPSPHRCNHGTGRRASLSLPLFDFQMEESRHASSVVDISEFGCNR